LRATTVSRLFQEGVDEKLIRGVTGHRSEALNSYKRETDKQLEVSKIVQGVECRKSKEKEDSLVIQDNPNAIGSIVLNICGGNCNITIGKK
jgi:hypothetical protein